MKPHQKENLSEGSENYINGINDLKQHKNNFVAYEPMASKLSFKVGSIAGVAIDRY